MSDDTSIRLTKGVRDRLRERGRKGETYNDIVKRLLDETASEDDE